MHSHAITTDELFTVLAVPQRRRILEHLQRNGVASIESLADHLADKSGALTSNGGQRPIRVALHHTHFPALEAAGLLEYDSATGRVELGNVSTDRLTGLLEIEAERR